MTEMRGDTTTVLFSSLALEKGARKKTRETGKEEEKKKKRHKIHFRLVTKGGYLPYAAVLRRERRWLDAW